MARSLSKVFAVVPLFATAFAFVAPACSSTGQVSLGKNDDGLTVCAATDCGPEPGVSTTICPDGSKGGFTGRCVKAAGSTTCGWEIKSCGGDPACTPPPPVTCADGTVTVSGCGRDSSGDCVCGGTGCPDGCTSMECGPVPALARVCPDGSIGKWVCDKSGSTGTCGWSDVCPTAIDGGVIDAIATDAPSGDAGSACFDPSGTIPYEYKRCGTDSECTTAEHQTDCCGNKTRTGINAAESSTYSACEKTWDGHFPGCGCPEGPDKTDDGQVITDPTKVVVHCVAGSGGATGTCATTLSK